MTDSDRHSYKKLMQKGWAEIPMKTNKRWNVINFLLNNLQRSIDVIRMSEKFQDLKIQETLKFQESQRAVDTARHLSIVLEDPAWDYNPEITEAEILKTLVKMPETRSLF